MKRLLLFVALLAVAGISRAQFLSLGVKLGYGSEDPQAIIDNVQSEVSDMSNATDFLRKCNAGLMVRMKFGNRLYLQPEANFSLNSVWDSVDAAGDLFGKITESLDQVQSVSLSVPVLIGFKLFELEDFMAVRLFAGPEFYTSIASAKEEGFNLDAWSAVAGLGIDLIDLLYVDVRATYLNASERASNPPAATKADGVSPFFYTLNVGILF